MRRLLGAVLLTFALLQLGFRGMQRVRSDIPLWDFVSVHSAARAWIQGQNPYDLPKVVDTWHQSGLFKDRDVSYFATVYPPSSLAVMTPLALFPAGPAMIGWLVLTIVLLGMQIAALADMAGLRWRDSRTLILVGAALASAPLQFGILSGQLSLPAIALCIIAFCCAGHSRDKLAGVLLGLACALKPQVGGPFVVYYLFLRRFTVAGFATLVGAAILAVALAAMRFSHIDWYTGWMQSIALTTRIGGVNDYGWTDKFRDEIVDLKMLLVGFISNPQVLRFAVLCIVAGLAGWYLRSFIRGGKPTVRDELLLLAGLSALALLPVYHRVYDVTLLTTALAWALAGLDGPRRRYALPLLIPMMMFLIPFDVIKSVGNRMPRLISMSETWWWQSLVAPHYAWGLLALTIGLLLVLHYASAAESTKDRAIAERS